MQFNKYTYIHIHTVIMCNLINKYIYIFALVLFFPLPSDQIGGGFLVSFFFFFSYHRYIQKTQTKEEKERKKITDEKTSPDLIGGEGKK